MIANWATIKAQLEADINTALSISAIHVGAPQKPITTYPHAIIQTGDVRRSWEGPRTVRETYEFQITIRQLKPSEGSTCESTGWTTLKTLGDRLTPPLTSEPYGAVARYGGVAAGAFVSSLSVSDPGPDESYFDVTLTFSCYCWNHE